jgi:choline dehydrogenase
LNIRLSQHKSFGPILGRLLDPTVGDITTNNALDAWIRRNVTTMHHNPGTLKTGPDSDKLAVIDQYCRVKGVNGLRVADTSVMPDCVRANTNATVIMISERVADFIKGDC